MVITHAKADPSINLESSIWRNHHNGGRFEWVLLGKYKLAPVESMLVRCITWAFDHIVPLEEIRFKRTRIDPRIYHWT